MTSFDATAFHLFCGAGGGALGFEFARASARGMHARIKTVGGIDCDPRAAEDFTMFTGAECLVADAASLQPRDLYHRFGSQTPDIVLSSPPCRSFSGLLPRARAQEPQYQELSQLALVGVHLMLATWDPPPPIVFLENVPNITTRGADLLITLRSILASYGYEIHEGIHDCGAIGGLAQRRKRWFLLARHRASLPEVVYQPPVRQLRTIGEVLQTIPFPGHAGSMHELPRTRRATWERLSQIPAGRDARSVFGKYFRGTYGVLRWDRPSGTVTAQASPSRGAFTVADPRRISSLRGDRPLSKAGAWHRPLTTLELAALQGFPTRWDGDWLKLAGSSHSEWRQRLGNAIPPPAAHAIGNQLLGAILQHRAGRRPFNNFGPVWCRRTRGKNARSRIPVGKVRY